jgi:Zn-dependent protease with chaperone function
MQRAIRQWAKRFQHKVLPFVLGLLLVGVQVGSWQAGRTIAATPAPAPTVSPKPQTGDANTIVVPGAGTPKTEPGKDRALPEALPPETPAKNPEEVQRFNQFVEADRLYQTGQTTEASNLYRQLKPKFTHTPETSPTPAAIQDIEQMPPAAKVYWRESEAGLAANLEGRIFVPLALLVKQYPQFIPGHTRLATAYEQYQKPEKALAVLEAASALYPNEPELLKLRIAALGKAEKWMDASIAARQFALLNPQKSQASEFTALADENLRLYRKDLKRKLTGNAIGNVLTGALGYALTGSLFGPLNSIQTSVMLLQGESSLGARAAKQAKKALPMIEDEETVKYVNEIGMKLAKVAGREDFEYEFNVIKEDDINAFALPGGKVFVNAGAIAKTNSEAELAGLLGHEISHAVLAHGLQLMTQGSLTANITQYIPYVGGLAESIITFGYSRDMERQADAVGTRLLASAGYAADGLWNLMKTMKQEELEKEKEKGNSRPPIWLSSHPGGDERVQNVEKLVVEAGYDRFAYEGVERHTVIQQKMQKLLKEEKEKQDKIKDKRKKRRGEVEETKSAKPEPDTKSESKQSDEKPGNTEKIKS